MILVQTEMGSQEEELDLLASSLSELKYLNPEAEFPVVEETVKKIQADLVQAKLVGFVFQRKTEFEILTFQMF